jgi:hypothetical protein
LNDVGARPDQVVRSVIYVVSDDNSVLAAAWRQLTLSVIGSAFTTTSTLLRRDAARIFRPAGRSRPHRRTLTTRPLVRSCVLRAETRQIVNDGVGMNSLRGTDVRAS